MYPYKGYNWRGISWQYIFEKLTTYLYQDLVNGTGEDPLLKKKVDANKLGLKTGRGFFDWKETPARRSWLTWIRHFWNC